MAGSDAQMETLESIDDQINELRAKRRAIEDGSFYRYTLPKVRDMVGKALAYRRNSYSCPSKPSDYWDVFRVVLEVAESHNGAWIIFQECQIDRDGKPSITLECSYVCSSHYYLAEWQPCDISEYEQNYQRALSALSSPKAYIKKLLNRE